MMLKLQYFIFLQRWWVNKKQWVNFMLGSWQRVNGRKKVENPWYRCRCLSLATFCRPNSNFAFYSLQHHMHIRHKRDYDAEGSCSQARNQLGTPWVANPKFFKLCPIVFNYAQHIFPWGAKNFVAGPSPPPSYGPGCSGVSTITSIAKHAKVSQSFR